MVSNELEPEILERIVSRGRERFYEAGRHIYARGEPGESMMIVRRGTAEVGIVGLAGRPTILGLIHAGDLVGDVACLDGGPRSADVIARTDVTTAVVARRDVLDLLRSDPDVALAVVATLCAKVRNASDMLELQTLPGARARLGGAVLRLVDESEGDSIELSQSWLGAFAGLTRENVNRQIRAFSKEGTLKFENGALHVLNRDALERATEE